MHYTIIDNCQEIALNCHALIEASAGTGKTYTIENLVVRFLKEKKDIELENILLVTFTEKAACELKLRIRQKIESELTDYVQKCNFCTPEIGKKLKNTLDAFDTASIFTIHSFCQSILRDFAFENNSPLFPAELINDELLYESLLKEQMRKEWHEQYQDDLPEVLAVSRFNIKKSRFLNTVIDIARQVYSENAGDILRPDADGKSFQELREELKTTVMAMKLLVGGKGAFSKGFEALNIHAAAKKSLKEKIVIPLEIYLSEVNEDNFDISNLSDLMIQIQAVTSSDRQGIECLVPKYKKSPNPQACPNLQKIKEKLDEAADIMASEEHLLAIQSIRRLRECVRAAKQNKGCISFNDMLTLVEESLHGDNSRLLLEKLREKYKVAFVDEFQDTDPVQWKIFRKIFLTDTEDKPENLLFLIGDPKQAIYAFRGADVYAYLEARNEMEQLAQRKQANLYSLAENWRSEQELIGHFNHLFCGHGWFPSSEEAGPSHIGYQAVRYPEGKERPESLIADNSGRPVLNIMDLSESGRSDPAKQEMAKFIASEIRYLSKECRIILKKKNEPERSLDFGDICILVRGKKDVPFIEKELLKLNIPYSYYKKPGLFLSDEAFYLSCVFHAVLDPGNLPEVKKALLTPFFEFSLTALYAYQSLPLSHPVKQILRQWNEYAVSRKWSFLFQSLIEESGLLFRESEKNDWDRTYTNYRQLFEYLTSAAYRKNLDFRGICALLDSHLKQIISDDGEADIHQIETEARKVQIMTMHVSKGLQFPVVFVAGGLTQPSHKKDYLIYHEPNSKVIDLSCRNGKEESDAETKEEVKRLFYVALTRAQCKLYLPFYPHEGGENWAGPVSYLLSPAITAAFSKGENKTALWLKPKQNRENVSAIVSDEERTETYILPEPLFPEPENHRHKLIRLESFSSLHKRLSRAYKDQEYGFHPIREEAKEDDEIFVSGPPAENTEEEIPGGTEVGSMFHAILEAIDFKAVERNEPEIREEIRRQREIFRIDEKWEDTIYEIIRKTLTAPIRFVEDGFMLACLGKEDLIREAEFYYPFPHSGSHVVPGCDIQNGYIRGSADLIFRYNKKYYIADWKSNRIEEGYHQEAMKNSMDQADYHLQYKIYTVALLRWLKQVMGDRFDPSIHFGGVFYFYLRGMGKENSSGIYHIPPVELGTPEHIEEEIGRILYRSLSPARG